MEKEIDSKIFLIAIIAIVVIVLVANNFSLTGEVAKKVPKSTPCYDSDGGKNNNVTGIATDFTGYRGVDYCINNDVLKEFYCNNIVNTVKSVMVNCSDFDIKTICKDGACIKKVATNWFRNAYWKCNYGLESSQGYPTSCKSLETWRRYADDFCGWRGVNTFSVSNECPSK